MAKIRVRARTVDMLGRQQIAGIPTAISELFKNAHDAYARNVQVDYYRSDNLFVLRDDGLGMTREDFEHRWLTLGTESKLAHSGRLPPPPVDPVQPRRAILGEKGIGRLAIAAIGPQVLVLSRALRNGRLHDGVAAFVHWGLFAFPGVDLDEIEIPVVPFDGGTMLRRSSVDDMIATVRENTLRFKKRVAADQIGAVLDDLGHFVVDPEAVAGFLGRGPSLQKKGHGTHFLIMPADETLKSDLESRSDQETASPLTKVLIGFTNTMTPGHARPPILASFKVHSADDVTSELIEGSEFFTPQEFESADHHFQGEFDEYGAFSGTIKIYTKAPVSHGVPWTGSAGNPTQCGPFRINIAYVQGKANESVLPPEEHARIMQKLNRIGGLYIYRDGVRILPYGNSDYDFLSIEQRRTKSAYYYFFSYRRIFGVIDVTRAANDRLVEKAGREGFRENIAYRQFREILENFFVQLAADFFRDDAAHGTPFREGKAELEQAEAVRRKQAAYVATRRTAFQGELDTVFSRINEREPAGKVADLLDETRSRLASLRRVQDELERARAVLQIEEETRRRLSAARDELRIARPRGIGLSKQLRRDWNAYQEEAARYEREVFEPAASTLANLVVSFCDETGTEIDRRRQLDEGLQHSLAQYRQRVGSQATSVRADLDQAAGRVLASVRALAEEFHRRTQDSIAEMSRKPMATAQTSRLLARFDATLEELSREPIAKLELLRADLARIANENLPNASEVAEVVEEDLDELRERELAGLELAQVGMALGIIHHEFASSVNSIREGLRRLKRWADKNAQLAEVHRNLRTAFDHLDGYLSLFTPLNRRLYRKKVPILGKEIHVFLTDLFGPRLARHCIELRATPQFLERKLKGYPSSFYPTFVNLVDNAIFWIGSSRRAERWISLDSHGDAFEVSDSGPGVGSRDSEAVFELGFSRKPSGRGMGLYISRETLKRVGYELTLDPYRKGHGATFRIQPMRDGAQDDE